MRRLAPFEKSLISLFVHAGFSMQTRYDDSGIDCIDAHSARSKFQSGTARELIESGFAPQVGEPAGKCTRPGNARYIDDVASSLGQMRDGSLHQLEYRSHVDAHHIVPSLKRGVLNCARAESARTVDENIEIA